MESGSGLPPVSSQGFGGSHNPNFQANIPQRDGNMFDAEPHAINMGVFSTDSQLTQMGLAYGKDALGRGTQMFHSQYSHWFGSLKYYFNVNNSYVINKLKLILFPLRHKIWQRSQDRMGEGEFYLPPREDINAPDLYIPTMAFVTFVLIIGYVMGAQYRFTPEVLGMTASSALGVWAVEVLIIKLGFYLLNSLTVPILDVVAYCGYKYVGLVLTVLGGFLFGQYVFYILMLTTGLFMGVFMVKTLKLAFPPSDGMQKVPNKKYFLLAIGVLQLLIQYYMAYDITTYHSLLEGVFQGEDPIPFNESEDSVQ